MAYAFNDDKTKYVLKKQLIVIEGHIDNVPSGVTAYDYNPQRFATDTLPDDFDDLILVSAMMGVYLSSGNGISWYNRLMGGPDNKYFLPEVSIRGKGTSGTNNMLIAVTQATGNIKTVYYRMAFMVKE